MKILDDLQGKHSKGKRHYIRAVRRGVCVRCFKKPQPKGFVTCESCREAMSVYAKQHHKKTYPRTGQRQHKKGSKYVERY